MAIELLLRLARRIAPREGWLILALVLAAVSCPAAAIMQVTQAPDAGRLLWLSLLAAIAGLAVARSRLNKRAAALAGGLLGSGLLVVVMAGLIPPLSLLWAEVTYLPVWVRAWLGGAPPATAPFAASAGVAWQRLAQFAGRLEAWGQAVGSSSSVEDQIGLMLLLALLAWAAAFFAAWQIFRRREALRGLIPAGAGVTLVVFLSGGGYVYLFLYLSCTLGLIAALGFWTQRQHWEESGIDYPGDLGLDMAMIVVPWLIVAVTLAVTFPHLRVRPVSRAFWELLDRPWSAVEQVSERVFGEIESRYPGLGSDVLPRDHLLTGGPELAQVVVLYVTTDDPPPPPPDLETGSLPLPSGPRRYWRSTVFDRYTGRGWQHSSLESHSYRADQPLAAETRPERELRQEFEIVEADGRLLYAVNEPSSVDRPGKGWWHAADDLAWLEGDTRRYSAVSRPPEPTVRELRAAPATLPPAIEQRYLALPGTIPQRVRDLARQVAGDAGSRYDQAKALETYLRTYTYTLDLPLPPANRDLVDYFLFDIKAGYCDYYASAMVVMARSLGIPARFVSGYAQGTYDYGQRRWVVNGLDAHSWVEIYFEGIGWVEFEPTAGQPALRRPEGTEPGAPAPTPPPATGLFGGLLPWPLVALGGLLVLLLAGIAAIWWPRRAGSLPASELARDRYRRLLRWGLRLGRPAREGETPYEFGAALAGTLSQQGRSSRWSGAREAAAAVPDEIEALADSFVRAQYSARPLDEREGWRIRALWERLRRHLAWLLLR